MVIFHSYVSLPEGIFFFISTTAQLPYAIFPAIEKTQLISMEIQSLPRHLARSPSGTPHWKQSPATVPQSPRTKSWLET